MSLDKLILKIKETQNPVVVGLDPRLDYVPNFIKQKIFTEDGESLKGASKAIYRFNKGIIEAIRDVVPAVKLQMAYYELFGYQGIKALAKTAAYAREVGLYVIIDGKRNDIGATMEAYASAYLGKTQVGKEYYSAFEADALTVNGYLGTDGISPLLEICKENDKGIFVLTKTSNPSSGELQDKLVDEKTVYSAMGDLCEKWGSQLMGKYGYSGVGAVVGATYPEQLAEMRARLPHTFFLVPGYGTQGGTAEDVSKAFDKNGMGAIVNASRSVICAYKKDGCDESEYAVAALREVIRMKKEILSHINTVL